jgi:hypothetical protein
MPGLIVWASGRWFLWGGVVVIFSFVADCTDAILARIDERFASSGSTVRA